MKVIKVLWVDSCNSNMNWTFAEDIEIELMYIDSFGVVVKDTDEFLAIAQNYGNNPEQYSHITTIPKGCIKEVFVMHEDNVCENEQNLPSFDESQGTPILKQSEQKSIDNLTPLEAMNIAIAKCFDEQKPADNVETKFKDCDWVVDKNGIVKQILSYKDGVYKHTNGYSSKMFEDEWRIWDITKDAKDGDVLHCWIDGDEFVLIYKGIKDGYITTYGHLYQKFKSFSEEPTTMFCRTIQGHFTPATKEQSDLLFTKMKEAGYEWDGKELKKVEQNPAWSEKDEKMLDEIIDFFKNGTVKLQHLILLLIHYQEVQLETARLTSTLMTPK